MLKVGDVVFNDFRTKYDRETEKGVVVEIKDNLYKVIRLGEDEKGYFDSGMFEWRTLGQLTLTDEHIENLNSLYE